MLKPCVGSPGDRGGLSAHSIRQVFYSCRGELHAGTGNVGQWLLDWVTQRSLLGLLLHPERTFFMFCSNCKRLTFFCID